MKQPFLKTLFFVWVAWVGLHPIAQAQESTFMDDYLVRLENSHTYMQLVAEAMPEELFSYKATPESMSFAEHYMHIAWAMDWHCQSLLGERPARDWETDETLKVAQKSKAEMMAAVDKTFTATMAFLQDMDPASYHDQLDYLGLPRNKRQIILLLADHISHHRGQMIVYLRLQGITPPRYIKYQ